MNDIQKPHKLLLLVWLTSARQNSNISVSTDAFKCMTVFVASSSLVAIGLTWMKKGNILVYGYSLSEDVLDRCLDI